MLRRGDRVAVVYATLHAGGWWTLRELAELAGCSESWAVQLVHRISQHEVVFRRPRRGVFKQPYEHRMFPQAVHVRLA